MAMQPLYELLVPVLAAEEPGNSAPGEAVLAVGWSDPNASPIQTGDRSVFLTRESNF